MAALGISRGRDAFFELLSARDLLVPVRRNRQRTTRSGWWRYSNLLLGLEVVRTYQVWVADITYIATEQGFVYLALVTDAFSRFIVGYDLSVSLAVEGCQRALEHAVAQDANRSLQGLIHHSDHGVQYTAYAYRDRLQALGIRPSMGEVGNCYDNALAERIIGTLKAEYGLADLFVDFDHADAAVHEAVWLYNYERPHLALDYQKPADLHLK